MKITPLMQRYILHWGEMGSRWGVNRTVAQIHALLYLASEPLTADDISQLLSVARSNVSTSLRELQGWDLIRTENMLGDRKDYYSAQGETWELLLTIIEGRKKREIDPTLSLLRQCAKDIKSDEETPRETKEKINRMLGFLTELTDWFDEIKKLPEGTLIKLLKMGATISKFIPGKNKKKKA